MSSEAAGHSPPRVMTALLVLLATQSVVVMAVFSAPVMALDLASRIGAAPHVVGYFSSVVFATAMLATLLCGPVIDRFGPVRISQVTALLAAVGLCLIALPSAPALFAGAVVLGIAYGPGNPASSLLLQRTTPPHRRATVFSLKQTAVPLGGVLAGTAIPALAALVGFVDALLGAAIACLMIALVVQVWRPVLDVGRTAALAPVSLRAPFLALREGGRLRRLAFYAFCLASVQFTFGALFVSYLQEAADVAATVAGPVLSVAMATSVAMRIVLGHAADRAGGRFVLAVLSIVAAFSALGAALFGGGGFLLLASIGVVLGVVSFSWNGIFLSEVAAAAAPGAVARATSGAMFFVFLGGFAGPGLAATIIALSASYAPAFLMLAALACLGTAALFRMR